MQIDFQWFLGMLGLFIGFIAKETWDSLKKNKHSTEQQLTETIAQLNVAIIDLKIKVEVLTERLSPIRKIQDDLNQLQVKVRALG